MDKTLQGGSVTFPDFRRVAKNGLKVRLASSILPLFGDGIDLNANASPQDGLDRCSCRPDSGEKFRVNIMESIELSDVCEVTDTLHDVIESAASLMEDLAYVVQSELRLLFNPALHNFAGGQV